MGRINYATILNRYKAIGKGNVRLTQSTLILSKPISATQTSYSFDVLETQNSTLTGTEIRLSLNDEFIITNLGIYLQATVSEASPGGASYGTKWFSYVPSQINSAAGVLNPVYNGALQIAVNNVVYLDKFDSGKSLCVPRTQDANFVTPNQATLGSTNYNKDGMISIEPTLVLSGAKKNNLVLNLASAAQPFALTVNSDSGSTKYTFDRIALVMRGLNAQNGASFQQ
jgi:hypothetical protein